MNVEVLKLRVVDLPNGSQGQILDLEDFKRLFVKYKITLESFMEMGLSRGLWKNTLAYYDLDVNKIEAFREYQESKHIRSYHGFSTEIPIKHLTNHIPSSSVKDYVKYLDSFFPGISKKYYKYKKEKPHKVRDSFFDINRELLDLLDANRKLSRVVKKLAIKNNKKPGKDLSHNKLEHSFSKILDELGLKYENQFTIKDYKYDFKIKNSNILIEIDGGGHTGGNDKKKNRLAKNNNYRLERFKIRSKFYLQQDYENIKDRVSRIKDSI